MIIYGFLTTINIYIIYIYIYVYIYNIYMVPPPRPTFLWFLLVFAVNYAPFELIFLVAVLGHVLVDLWGVPYIYILCFGFPCRRVLVTGAGSTRKRENAKIQKDALPLDAPENAKIRKSEKYQK